MREIKFRGWNNKSGMGGPFNAGDDQIEYYTDSDDTIMQYTGKTDCHEKEIYEGDILEYIGKTKQGRSPRRFKIIWHAEKCRFIGQNMRNKDQMFPIRLMTGDHKIIGNIHENPELLK